MELDAEYPTTSRSPTDEDAELIFSRDTRASARENPPQYHRRASAEAVRALRNPVHGLDQLADALIAGVAGNLNLLEDFGGHRRVAGEVS